MSRKTSSLTKNVAAVALLLAALLFGARDAAACSCTAPTFSKRYELSANVFTAVITGERTEQMTDRTTLVRSSFAVIRAFKGSQPFDALVSYRSDIVSCGLPLEVGGEYLFLVRDSGEVGVCPPQLAKELAGPEIAALDAFATGRRPQLVEPWHFHSSAAGCSLHTNFEAGQNKDVGSASFSVYRPGFDSANFGRGLVDIGPGADLRGGDVGLTIDGVTYAARIRAAGVYSITGHEAEQLVRAALSAETLRLRLGDLDVEISTANLADAGTGAQMLECIGPQ